MNTDRDHGATPHDEDAVDHVEARRTRLYRVTAIVLRRRDLGEADRLLTIFTREHGRIRVVAKGARRSSSRSSGHLEPFGVSRLLIARTRGLDIISQAESLAQYPRLRESEVAIATAGYIAELLDSLVPENEPHPDIFDGTRAAFDLLDAGSDPLLVRLAQQLGMMRALGYQPRLMTCLQCGCDIHPGGNAFAPDGGVVCVNCALTRPDAWRLDDDALKLLRVIDRGDVLQLFRLRMPPEAIRSAAMTIERYTDGVIGYRSRAQEVIGQLGLEQ